MPQTGLTKYISKTDFKMARSCFTKLHYYKNNYPNTLEDDEYLKLMAEGGYMIGKIAQLMHPEGILISMESGAESAFEETKKELAKDSVTLFEPVILTGNKLIRVDILIKQGNFFEIIEVKSKSYDENKSFQKKNGEIRSDWRDYIDDIAFQTIVFKEAFPQSNVTPYLMLVDKRKTVTIDGLTSQFSILDISSYEIEGFRSFDVEFSGDVEKLKSNNFLVKLDVSTPVTIADAEIKLLIKQIEASSKNNFKKEKVDLSKKCKGCEFESSDTDSRHGFNECWGDLSKVKPNILNLYQFTRKKECDLLIANRKVALDDVPKDILTGAYGERQKIQIEYTQKNKEWISDDLFRIMESCKYPLHFIDFETARLAVSPHKGMKPYGNIAFQWSCHTISQPGSEPIHSEWINTKDSFPNIKFALTLFEQIGFDGTVFMWSPHENTTLKEIYESLVIQSHPYHDLERWLDHMTKKDSGEDYTMVDLCALTKKYYFHPDMQGSLSIKYVLPAVWKSFPNLENHPQFKKYYRVENGNILSPYDLLEPISIEADHQVIRDGTGAMKAYQEMMYGRQRHNLEIRQKWTNLLRQYCELDTLAMLAIWEYWNIRYHSSN